LDEAIATLERRIAGRAATTANPLAASGSNVLPDTFFRMTVPDAIKQFLKMVGRPARATTDIVDALNKGGLNVAYPTVYTSLGRLKDKGEVVKAGENWGLDSWYPPATQRIKINTIFGGVSEPEATLETEEPSVELLTDENLPVEEQSQSPKQEKQPSRKDLVAEFLKTHGPSTRAEIMAATGIGASTYAFCMKDGKRFVKGEDGKWRNVE